MTTAMQAVARALAAPVLLLLLLPAGVRAQVDVTGRWDKLTPDLPFFPVHMHLLPNGKVMLWPGDAGISGNDPRLWDPTSSPTQTTLVPLAKPGFDLFCAGHSFLADGRLFVAGGHIQNNVGLKKASLYDPVLDKWSNAPEVPDVPDMNAGRWYPTVTTLANGDALVVSGSIDTTVGTNTLPQVYQAATGTWRSLTNAQLLQDLYPFMFLAPNGKVALVGPARTSRYLDTSGTGAWTTITRKDDVWRDYGSAVMYEPGKILVVGGGNPPTATAQTFDLNEATPTWRNTASMSIARRQLNATLLPDGTVLVSGGTYGAGTNNTATPVFHAESWNPATGTWTQLASASVPRLYHSSALLLPDGRVLTTGGNNYRTAEVFSPPYLFKGARPTMSGVPSGIAYGQRFSVQTADAASISKVTLIRLGSVTHAFDMNQRLNTLSFTPTATGLDITPPANGNLAPPGHYMLFIVKNGVPSVGSVVWLSSSNGSGTGLSGRYYNNVTLSGSPVLTRSEAVDFGWGTASPGTNVPVDRFSVRWSGVFEAPTTGTYRLQTVGDDGIRLTVNNTRMIDKWVNRSATTDTTTAFNLTAGQRVPIVLEYYENVGGAVARLRWQTPGATDFVAIPRSRLYTQ